MTEKLKNRYSRRQFLMLAGGVGLGLAACNFPVRGRKAGYTGAEAEMVKTGVFADPKSREEVWGRVVSGVVEAVSGQETGAPQVKLVGAEGFLKATSGYFEGKGFGKDWVLEEDKEYVRKIMAVVVVDGAVHLNSESLPLANIENNEPWLNQRVAYLVAVAMLGDGLSKRVDVPAGSSGLAGEFPGLVMSYYGLEMVGQIDGELTETFGLHDVAAVALARAAVGDGGLGMEFVDSAGNKLGVERMAIATVGVGVQALMVMNDRLGIGLSDVAGYLADNNPDGWVVEVDGRVAKRGRVPPTAGGSVGRKVYWGMEKLVRDGVSLVDFAAGMNQLVPEDVNDIPTPTPTPRPTPIYPTPPVAARLMSDRRHLLARSAFVLNQGRI